MRAFTLLFSTQTTSKKIVFAMPMNCFSAACHTCKCIFIHLQILQTDTAKIFVGCCWSWWWWIRGTSFSLSNGRFGCSRCCFFCIGSRFTGLLGLRRTCIFIHCGGNGSGQRQLSVMIMIPVWYYLLKRGYVPWPQLAFLF